MTNIENTDGIIHLKLYENLKPKDNKKKQRGRPKEKIPDGNVVSVKVLEDLTSIDFLRQWNALSEVLQACGSYRKAEKWLRKYCPSLPTSRKQMAKILKSHALMSEITKKKVRIFLEESRKNPYLSYNEFSDACELAIREVTRQKIRQSSNKHPVGTKKTDERTMNLREWKLRKKAEKDV